MKKVHFVKGCHLRGPVCGVSGYGNEVTYQFKDVTCKNCQKVLKIGPYKRKIVHLARTSMGSTLCGRALNRTGWNETTDRKKVTCKMCLKIMKTAWGVRGGA